MSLSEKVIYKTLIMKLSRIILKKYLLFFLFLFLGNPLMAQGEDNTDFRNGIYFNSLGLLGYPSTIHISYERELFNKNSIIIGPRLIIPRERLSGTGVEVQYRVRLHKRFIDPDLIYDIPTTIIYFAPYASYDYIKKNTHSYYPPYNMKDYISSYSFGIVFGMKFPVYQFPNLKSKLTLDTYLGIGYSSGDYFNTFFYRLGYSGSGIILNLINS